MRFDYTRAIEINQNALSRVVEEIFALLEIVLDGTVKNLPLALQQAAYRLLVPAESALRRLIIIAAQGMKVKLPKPRGKPHVSAKQSKSARPLNFQMFDTRKRFFRKSNVKLPTPRIHVFNGPSLVSISAPKLQKSLTSTRILRRFAAFKLALENIPKQAKRMALWQAKRAHMKSPKFRSPMRPGAPPGFRRSLTLKIDLILNECHHLAVDKLREAPS